MARELTDLPDPDSPTTATTSPGATSKLMPRTAWTVPASVLKSTVRSRRLRVATRRFSSSAGELSRCGAAAESASASSSANSDSISFSSAVRGDPAAGAQQGIEDVVEALADQRRAQHDQHDRGAREHARPPDAGRGIGERLVEVVAPLRRRRRLDAEAEEAEPGQGQDRLGRVERGDDRQRRRDVGEDVLEQDARRAGAHHPRGVHVGLDLDGDRGVADQAEVLRDEDHRDRYRRGHDAAERPAVAAREHDRDDDGEQQRRERVERVHDQDEHAVDPPGDVAGHQAEWNADDPGEDDREEDDLDRGAGAEDDARQHVGAADRGAEPVGGRGRLLVAEADAAGSVGIEVVGSEERREHRDEQERDDDADAEQQHEPLEAVAGTQRRQHQNLTRGSTNATMTSIRKLAAHTIRAIRVTMPWTARKSRRMRYSASW